MCFYDAESPEMYRSSIRKARKERRCDGCFKPILPGDLYVDGNGKFEGDFYTFQTCGVCEVDRNKIHEAELARGCSWNESWCPVDELAENLPEYGLQQSSKDAGQDWLQSRRVDRQHAHG